MKIKLRILTLGVFLAGLSSCYWDNEETLYGSLQSTCDVSAVTYTLTVAPIIDYNCNGCHSTQDASILGSNIVLDNYTQLLIYANSGQLSGSIQHSAGYSQMPKAAAKLTDCDILKIQTWITDGKLNN